MEKRKPPTETAAVAFTLEPLYCIKLMACTQPSADFMANVCPVCGTEISAYQNIDHG